MLLESATLQKIVTKNVVKVMLESVQLQNNFQLILKALKSHDSLLKQFQTKFTTVEQQLSSLSSSHSSNLQTVTQMDKKYEGQIKNVNVVINASDNRLRKVQLFIDAASRLNPESSKQNARDESQMAQYVDSLNKLEAKVSKVQQNLNELNNKSAKLQQMETGLKRQQQQISMLAQQLKQVKRATQELTSNSNKADSQQTNNDSEDIKKMRKDIEGLNQKIRGLQVQTRGDTNELNKSVNKLKQIQDELLKQNKKISDEIWKLNDQLYQMQKQEGQNRTILDDILKQLEDLRLLLTKVTTDSRDRTLSAKNTYSLKKDYDWDTQTPIKPQAEVKLEGELKDEAEKDSEQSNFKKEIIDKLRQQKGDFTKAIKRLDIVSHKKEEQEKQRLNRLEQRIRKLQFLVEGKVDEQNLKKWMKYIENKIGYLYRIVNFQITEEDACIARKNWICLSCDKKLETYKGKVGNHLIGAQLKGKTIESEVVGGGMLFKNRSKLELPQFKK